MRIFFFLVTIFVINFEVDAIEIDCKLTSWWLNHHGYACEVLSINLASSDDSELTNVTGAHESGYSNDDVEYYFQNVATELKFFPQSITKFFKNVRDVTIRNTKITAITKEDLKIFGEQLRRLTFEKNNLEVIDADLFDYTPNLEYISLTNNKIKHVGSGIFNNLQKLTRLYYHDNPCTSDSDYAYNRAGVIKLIATLESRCKVVTGS